VYTAVGASPTLYAGLAIVMTGVVLLGLLRRERYGVARIGSESVAVLGLYAIGIVLVL
jgi:cation:H+ antiporter